MKRETLFLIFSTNTKTIVQKFFYKVNWNITCIMYFNNISNDGFFKNEKLLQQLKKKVFTSFDFLFSILKKL